MNVSSSVLPLMIFVVSTRKRALHSGRVDKKRRADISEKVQPPRNTTSTVSMSDDDEDDAAADEGA